MRERQARRGREEGDKRREVGGENRREGTALGRKGREGKGKEKKDIFNQLV